ncbi:hypothetical protein MMC34_000259 [Xylographa carneopallida]|nr:hypothetical protein [Xylographa carneopallida]
MSTQAPPSHPPPLTIAPSKPHTHTLILLHGLSTDGPTFGTSFLHTATNSHHHPLPSIFPSTKFVFPSGLPRPCSAFGGALTNAWFDVSSTADRTHGEHLQVAGVRESSIHLLALIGEELALLAARGYGSEHLALGGFSQGCAIGAWVLLHGGVRLGAFVGLSGWLPFRRQVEEGCKGCEDVQERRGRARECMARAVPGCAAVVVESEAAFRTPVFLGHGMEDGKVRTRWGEEMRDAMRGFGVEVTWRGYEGLGHWFEVPAEVDDVINFLRDKGF